MAFNLDSNVFAVFVLLLVTGHVSTAQSRHTGPLASDKTHDILEEIRTLRLELFTVQSADKQREADMTDLKQRLNNLEQVQDNLQVMYDNMRTSHDDLQVQHNDLQVQHNDLQVKHNYLQVKHKYVKTKHDDIHNRHDDLQMKHDDLPDKHDDLQANHDDLQAKYNELQTIHGGVTAKYVDIQVKLDDPKHTYDDSRTHRGSKLEKTTHGSTDNTQYGDGQQGGDQQIQTSAVLEEAIRNKDHSKLAANPFDADLLTGVVGFFVRIDGFIGSPSEYSTIPFDVVVFNLGNAYEPTNGAFEAPVAGVYTFSYLTKADDSCGTDNVCTMLNVNGAAISATCSQYPDSAGASTITQLNVGDFVSVVTHHGAPCHTLGESSNLYNTFSGHLVYQII